MSEVPASTAAAGPKSGPIELAHEQPFRLGALAAVPRSRELVAPDGHRRTLEPRVMQVLVALAHADGAAVSRDELIRRCWNGTVVGDDSINRTISLLRKAAEEIGGEAAFRIETIPKLGYRLVVHGAERAPAPRETAPRARGPAPRRLAWATLAIGALAAAGIVLSWRTAPSGPDYSVSVQPFRVAGAVQGFDEQLLSTLTSQNVPTVAGRIGLAVTGSVEERDGAIRVDARIADSTSGEVVWSGAILQPAAEPDGLARAAEIVGNVAQCTLAGANDAGGTVPLDILSLYARTCELGYRGQPRQGLRVARELTRRSPEFAAGWFALSFHAGMVHSREPRRDPALRAEALAAADKLIALRPNAQDGYASKYLVTEPVRFLERERLLRRAIGLEPIYADVAHAYQAEFLAQVGRLEEAYQVSLTLAQQTPDVPQTQRGLFQAAAATERWPIAEQALARVRERDPAMVPALLWRKAVWNGAWDEARRLTRAEGPAQQEAANAAYRALKSGTASDRADAARLLRALPADCCLRHRIELLAQLGHAEDAIALLGTYGSGNTPASRMGPMFLWDPALRSLWYAPAIEPFLRRNGWMTYWTQSGTKPDICKDGRSPLFCRRLEG